MPCRLSGSWYGVNRRVTAGRVHILQPDNVDNRQAVSISGARFSGEDDNPQIAAMNGEDVAVQGDRPHLGMMNRLAVFPVPGHRSAVPQITKPAAHSPKISNKISQPSVRGIPPGGGAQIGHQQGLKVLSLLRRLRHMAELTGEVPPYPITFATSQGGRITQESRPRSVARQHRPRRVVHTRRHVAEAVQQPLGTWPDIARHLPSSGSSVTCQKTQILVFRPGKAQRAGQRVEHRSRWPRPALLEALDVIRRHTRQRRKFLPAQTTGAPLTAGTGKAHCGRRQPLAPATQHAAQFMALHHALIMLPVRPAQPGPNCATQDKAGQCRIKLRCPGHDARRPGLTRRSTRASRQPAFSPRKQQIALICVSQDLLIAAHRAAHNGGYGAFAPHLHLQPIEWLLPRRCAGPCGSCAAVMEGATGSPT